MATEPTRRLLQVQAEAVAYRHPHNGYGLAPTSLYRGTLTGDVWLYGRWRVDTALRHLAERPGRVLQNSAAQVLATSSEEDTGVSLENLRLPPQVILQRLDPTRMRFGLVPFRTRFPQTTSGFEQQILALAAVLAWQPVVLGPDEPFLMLDSSAAVFRSRTSEGPHQRPQARPLGGVHRGYWGGWPDAMGAARSTDGVGDACCPGAGTVGARGASGQRARAGALPKSLYITSRLHCSRRIIATPASGQTGGLSTHAVQLSKTQHP